MDWILSIIFFVLGAFFLIMGGSYKNNLWIFLGLSFLLILGVLILVSGLSIPNGWVIA